MILGLFIFILVIIIISLESKNSQQKRDYESLGMYEEMKRKAEKKGDFKKKLNI